MSNMCCEAAFYRGLQCCFLLVRRIVYPQRGIPDGAQTQILEHHLPIPWMDETLKLVARLVPHIAFLSDEKLFARIPDHGLAKAAHKP